jgi:nucleotide-binding universal stress UspA family protein
MGITGAPYVTDNFVDIARWEQEALRGAEAHLKALLSDEDRRELDASGTAIVATSPAIAILEYAKEHQIDLIIAGTHGRGPLGHFLMGSVAERLVRTARCPVLVVRHPEREFVLPDALEVVAKKV